MRLTPMDRYTRTLLARPRVRARNIYDMGETSRYCEFVVREADVVTLSHPIVTLHRAI
jgi:hypothetical protein